MHFLQVLVPLWLKHKPLPSSEQPTPTPLPLPGIGCDLSLHGVRQNPGTQILQNPATSKKILSCLFECGGCRWRTAVKDVLSCA